jgi:hypothetical protein
MKQRTEFLSILDYVLVKQKGRQTSLCRMAAGIPGCQCALNFFAHAVWNRKSCYQITELCYTFETCNFQNLATTLCRLYEEEICNTQGKDKFVSEVKYYRLRHKAKILTHV